MMISPEMYILEHKDDSYEQLIKEQDSLIKETKQLEKIVFSNDKTDEAWSVAPGPDVRYQMSLEYLGELCKFMKDKYNKEYVWRKI